MKRIVYSAVLKFIAVVLFVIVIVNGALTVVDGIIKYSDEDIDIYAFERDFSESWYIMHLLDEPENIIFNAYYSFLPQNGESGSSIDKDKNNITISLVELKTKIREGFEDYYNTDKINYYVKWDYATITNCDAKSAEDLMHGDYYSYVSRDGSGNIERKTSIERKITQGFLLEEIDHLLGVSTIVICSNIDEDAVNEYRAIWERQEKIVFDTFLKAFVCILMAILLLIYLICVCGTNKAGECKNMWVDNVWIEVHLSVMAGAGIGAAVLCVAVIDEFISRPFHHDLINMIVASVSALGSLIIITSLLSVVRNIKTGRLIKTSIILRLARWILRIMAKTAKWVWRMTKVFWKTIFGMLSKKTGVILITMLFVYTAVIGALGVGTPFSPIWLVIGILVFIFACFVVSYRAKDLDEVKKGISEVRNGNVSYKIPELKCEDMRSLGASINDIAKGFDESVSAKVRAERMKSELITNVSHDLKTPITSIISYTELLAKIDDLPEEAKDYVSVLSKKSYRLKRLTQDLFDISKAQSGNDDVVLERLDVALLISQALGEHDSEIQSSGLPFCVEVPRDLYISADGRKMSRVLSNLINNILKYTMKNTRVFISATEKEDYVVMEFKNISAYPLNFNTDEITQRFVRGDESRTEEGNGLGLAIAKSYTEICNGSFEIIIDGDMFKAILKLKKYI
ncbi:MAG: HAMP domain-containing histidine kinase [Ruminococcaceae bacterium]|nr:HAMP domain-containing histidine kinase [Oscillospiraceae bacterium]